MNIRKFWMVVLALSAGASLFGQKAAPESGAAEETRLPPIIRMDLLEKPPSPSGPPRRNIFAARAAGAVLPALSPGAAGTLIPPAANIGRPAAGEAGQGETPPSQPPAFTIDLRYVGFVDTEKTGRIIGLVVFQGQARAVVEGEVISEGISIGRITRKEIAVIMPDAKTKTFSLEGEER